MDCISGIVYIHLFEQFFLPFVLVSLDPPLKGDNCKHTSFVMFYSIFLPIRMDCVTGIVYIHLLEQFFLPFVLVPKFRPTPERSIQVFDKLGYKKK